MTSLSLAARAGRWSAAYRKLAILGRIAFVALATVIGGSVGQKQLDQSAMGNGESKRAELIIAAADFPEQVTEQVLVQGKGTVKAGDPEIDAAVRDVVTRLESIDGVTRIESPLQAQHRAQTVSADGRSVVVNFRLPGDPDEPEKLEEVAAAPVAAVAAVQEAHPQVRVEEYGVASGGRTAGRARGRRRLRLDRVLARPLISVIVAGGLLVAL